MLYHKKEQPFSQELFLHPTAEYRGAPFWAWNCLMTKENIDASLDALQAMGMGGGHIHCRTGMANPYLGSEFMELVKYTNEALKERGMLTWLYDEDRWPSGAGGGYVTKEHAYRVRFLVFSPRRLEGVGCAPDNLSSTGQAVRSDERSFLARYGVMLQDGSLRSYRMLADNEEAGTEETEWYAYLEVSGDNPWFNDQAYLNTLDKRAVKRFIEVTHEAYARELGGEFGRSVPAVFTDEPQFSHKERLRFAEERREVTLPFTDDLEETFARQYGHSLLAHLPELFWELPGQQVSLIRYEYHDHIAERFASAFADSIGTWCREHGLMLTGHMMEEPTLMSQTAALGEAMRSYRAFDIPGVDMLCDRVELSTVKQAESAAHQYGRPGVMSELYGVTNWDFDFKGHKLQGDWQAALGVTVRVPHLTWTSMAGEAKRDYPASIGPQSPWYREYPYIENYFARLNTVLTRGRAQVRIGVIHPIESYWLYWGTQEQTGAIRNELDEQFTYLIEILLYGLLDFDFICESLLPELTEGKQGNNGRLIVGDMGYDVILVPNCLTLRSSTLDVLERFAGQGGRVVFAGRTPRLEGAVPSERPVRFAERCTCIPFCKETLLEALEDVRFLDVRDESGNRSDNLIYQLREDGEERWLFLSHVRSMENPDVPQGQRLKITLQGIWQAEKYDALTGDVRKMPCAPTECETVLHETMYEQDSLLLRLRPIEEENAGGQEVTQTGEVWEPKVTEAVEAQASGREAGKDNTTAQRITTRDAVAFSLEEPNVLVLDQAEYSFDSGQWQPREEILRIDNLFRERLGYPLRMEAFAQPWVGEIETNTGHSLALRMDIYAEAAVEQVWLAMEDAGEAQILWNGNEAIETDGWYVDRCIQKVALGALQKGHNELQIELPYHQKCNVEAMYLLGSFGVRVEGASAVVTQMPETLAFGDITSQGLPFYGGNLTYHVPVELERAGEASLSVTKFRAPVLKIAVDGEEKGYIAFSPYRLDLGRLAAETHRVDITCFGSRVNTFGTLHNCDEQTEWYGPNAWRTENESWAYEYQLKRVGVLKAPQINF